jgi:hypothetical protein
MTKEPKSKSMRLNAGPNREQMQAEASEVFAEALLSNGGDATKAARAAGYRHPTTYGPKKASKPEMRALIEERIGAAAVRTDEIVGSLVVIMRENTSAGDPSMVRNALQAANQLCKVLGLYQRPRPNEQDQKTREMFERVIAEHMEDHGLSRREVVERMLAINPELDRWITAEG